MSGIKLFGMKIPLPEFQIPASSQMGCQIQANSAAMNACSSQKKAEVETRVYAQNSKQPKNASDLRDIKQEYQNNEQENEPRVNPKPVRDDTETSSTNQDHKSFKKPDKIVPCPRCNSSETKFCYFNNYNVNQPRHYCKNCQRYWTAGGTMRNVPVGAGRRKHRHLASQFRHIIVPSDGIPTAADNSSLEPVAFRSSTTDNGTVLQFGPDVPLCESMESSMLSLRDQMRSVDANSINRAENEAEDPYLRVSSPASACSTGNELSELNSSRPLQCYPVPPPWVFPWNPGWNNNIGSTAAVNRSPVRECSPYSTNPAAIMQWCPKPMVAVPSIPLPFVPAGSYWMGGAPVWAAAGTGTVSIGSNGRLPPSSGNGSPALGKHTRDTVFTDEEKSEMCVFVPKTLRIEDPNGRVLGVSRILEANPAAISRAHAFQETI